MSLVNVTKIGHFEYAHRILNHPGKCKNLHGHSGKVEVTIRGPVDPKTGMVIDFGYLSAYLGTVSNTYDHKTLLQTGDPLIELLNTPSVIFVRPPTAEVIALDILESLKHFFPDYSEFLYSVKMWETETSSVEVS